VAVCLTIVWPIAFRQPLYAGFGATDLILPAIGRADGVGGSHFYTTASITNPSTMKSADFEASFLKSGQSNPKPPAFRDSIAPGATKAYANAAEVMFAKNEVGAMRVRSARRLQRMEALEHENAELRQRLERLEKLLLEHPPEK
jgi:hypothetical protein